MKHLTNQQIELYITEAGVEYRLSAHEGQYDLYIATDRPDHFELSIEEWGNTVHDSVPFTSLLEALRAADAMIAEMEAMSAEVARNAYALIVERATGEAPSSWDPDQLIVYSSTDYSQADSAFDERGFLLDLVETPLPAMSVKHLRSGAAEAFEMFKREGFVELAVKGDLWCVTNKGRERLGMGADTAL